MAVFAKTVQRKLLLLLLTVGFVPAAIGILYTYYGVNVGFSQVLEDLVRDEAQQSMRRLDEILASESGRARELQSLLSQELTDGGPRIESESDAVQQMLQFFIQDTNGVADSVTLIDSTGRVLEQATRGTTQSMTQYTKRTRILDIPMGLWSGAQPRKFFSEITDEQGTGLRIFLVAESSNGPQQTTAAVIVVDLRVSSLLVRLRGPASGSERRIISNRGGQVVGGPPDEKLSSAVRNSPDLFDVYTGLITSPSGDQDSIISGVANSRFLIQQRRDSRTSLGWLMVSSVGLDEARAVGAFLLWRSVLLGIVLIPFLILLSTVMAQRFLKPLRQIHASLDSLAEGRMAGRVVVKTGDEFQDLAEAYNRMADRIKAASLELLSQIRSSKRQAREVTLVNDVCQSLAAEFDRERLFETARKRLTEILRHDCMSAVIADPAGHSTLHHFAGGAVRGAIPPNDILAFCQASIRKWASSSRRPSGSFLTPHGNFAGTGVLHPDCHELAVIPLLAGEILLGALILGRHSPDPFQEEELQSVRPIARFLAVAAEHIQLYERTVNFAAELENTVRARTEQLESAHRQLLMTERFAATGKLAANIAHEINNPLGIIKNYLRIHRNGLGNALPPDSAEALTVMEEELDRIARIVRRLLAFYRTPSMEPTPTDLNAEIDNMLSLLRSTLEQKGIQVQLQLSDKMPCIRVVPDLLRQVILNICKNAEEAMEGVGTMLLATSMQFGPTGPFIQLEVADTGCGIPPEHLAQIFEPFFTSKAEGQGTGLGLAVTYGIIQGMNGEIRVESDLGLGTRFILNFPVAPDDLEESCVPEGGMREVNNP